jgi:hypothetical protein
MKIFYLNDEHQAVTIQVNHQFTPSPIHPYGDPKIEYFSLLPGEGRMFDIDAPATAIPYVKRWENRHVLLTYM